MENKKNNTIWYIIAAIAVIALVAVIWYIMSNRQTVQFTNGNTNVNTSGQIDNSGSENSNSSDNNGQVSAEEQARLDTISEQRSELLAEQAKLEAQTSGNSTSTSFEDQQAQAQAQQDIEFQLLELKNQEEYPPLPDPGV